MIENTPNQNFLQEEESSITLYDIWNMIWDYKWWYVASVAFFLVLGAFYLYRTPNVYTRTAKVLIDESNQDATMRNLGVASAGMMRLRSFNSVENEMEAFSSPDLMQVVVERLGLQTKYVVGCFGCGAKYLYHKQTKLVKILASKGGVVKTNYTCRCGCNTFVLF